MVNHMNPRGLRNGGVSALESEDASCGDSMCIISCSRDGCVKLWDGQSGLCLKTFTANDAAGGWGGVGAAGAGGSWVRCVCVPESRLRPAPFFASGGNDQRQVKRSIGSMSLFTKRPGVAQAHFRDFQSPANSSVFVFSQAPA